MNLPIDPATILQKVKVGQLSKSEALKILESILTESESDIKRTKAIQSIGALSFYTNTVYKLLEKSMISDESSLVRVESAKIILDSFSDRDFSPILWAIENENSIVFFKLLLDFFELNSLKKLTLIKNQVINKLTKIYDLLSFFKYIFVVLLHLLGINLIFIHKEEKPCLKSFFP